MLVATASPLLPLSQVLGNTIGDFGGHPFPCPLVIKQIEALFATTKVILTTIKPLNMKKVWFRDFILISKCNCWEQSLGCCIFLFYMNAKWAYIVPIAKGVLKIKIVHKSPMHFLWHQDCVDQNQPSYEQQYSKCNITGKSAALWR